MDGARRLQAYGLRAMDERAPGVRPVAQRSEIRRARAATPPADDGQLTLAVNNPDSGSATEELEVEYASDALDIGFNSRYLLDIAAQIEGEVAVLKLADPGSPTLVQDKENKGALYVLMPMRV